MKETSKKFHTLENQCLRSSDLQARRELVDLLFSPVWVPGKYLTSLLGHWLKSLGTTGLHGHLSSNLIKINQIKAF